MNGEKGVVRHVRRLCAMLTLKKEEVDLRGRGEKEVGEVKRWQAISIAIV